MRIAGRRRGREPQPPPERVVSIDGEVIRLGQFLKLAGLVDSGAEAKDVIAEGLVEVDGEVDTRRGRQLRAGAVVVLRGERVRVGEPGEEPDVPW
jgi:ribosome-associated protein